MKITYYGQSALGIETNGKFILVDPFISGNELAAEIDINTLRADYILLTHAHGDHVMDVEAIAKRTGATLISNHEIVTWFSSKGIDGHGMNHGGSWVFDFGRIKMVNAIHSSSFDDGSYGGNPAGYVIESAGKTIYIAGDTALTMDMKLIPMFFKLDLAVLPVGGNYTMDVQEAVVASDFVACNRVLGIHYDTFPPIRIDHASAKSVFSDKNKELILLKIGAHIEL